MSATEKRRLGLLIVDDEPPARSLLREYVSKMAGFSVLGECANGFEAVKSVEELRPDILLLDIQMPKLNGFEVLEILDEPPHVIFTTAFDQFALKAFEVAAVDYLLKPFERDRLEQALERARGRIEHRETQPLASLASQHRRNTKPLSRVIVREGSKVHVVVREAIDYVESQDDYVSIHTEEKLLRKKQTLAELEELLGDPFVRIHRCYLLNVDRLERIEPYAKDSRVAFLTDGTRLPVSRSGYSRLKRFL